MAEGIKVGGEGKKRERGLCGSGDIFNLDLVHCITHVTHG